MTEFMPTLHPLGSDRLAQGHLLDVVEDSTEAERYGAPVAARLRFVQRIAQKPLERWPRRRCWWSAPTSAASRSTRCGALAPGARRVVYADTDAGRLAEGGELGAEPLEGIPEAGGPFQVAVDGSASRERLAGACGPPIPAELHAHRDPLRAGDAAARARDVHEGPGIHIGRAQARATIPGCSRWSTPASCIRSG